jgi:uncharacterized membrane protein
MNKTKQKVTNEAVTDDTGALPSAFNLFEPSINILRANLGTYALLLLAPLLFGGIAIIPGSNLFGSIHVPLGVSFGGMIIALLFTIITAPALIYTQLQGTKGKQINFGDAFRHGLTFFWRLVGLGICMGAIYLVSILLLFVPFLFMLRRYTLAPYFLVDRNLKISEALKQSAEASKEYSSAVWGLIGVQFLTNALGIIPVLGMIVGTIAQLLYTCAPAVRYREIITGLNGKLDKTYKPNKAERE